MDKNLIAKASVVVNVGLAQAWDALVNPKAIKQYMFGADVLTDWREGSPIIWKGEWQGKPYEDKASFFSASRNVSYNTATLARSLDDRIRWKTTTQSLLNSRVRTIRPGSR